MMFRAILIVVAFLGCHAGGRIDSGAPDCPTRRTVAVHPNARYCGVSVEFQDNVGADRAVFEEAIDRIYRASGFMIRVESGGYPIVKANKILHNVSLTETDGIMINMWIDGEELVDLPSKYDGKLDYLTIVAYTESSRLDLIAVHELMHVVGAMHLPSGQDGVMSNEHGLLYDCITNHDLAEMCLHVNCTRFVPECEGA